MYSKCPVTDEIYGARSLTSVITNIEHTRQHSINIMQHGSTRATLTGLFCPSGVQGTRSTFHSLLSSWRCCCMNWSQKLLFRDMDTWDVGSSGLRDAYTLSDHILCGPCEGCRRDLTQKACVCSETLFVCCMASLYLDLSTKEKYQQAVPEWRIVLLVFMSSCECHWMLVLCDEWQFISSCTPDIFFTLALQCWQIERWWLECKANDARCLIFRHRCDTGIMWKLSE